MVMERHASVAVIGAGDYIGAAIARRFAREGYLVHAGRRNGETRAAGPGHHRRRRTVRRQDAGCPPGRRRRHLHEGGRRGGATGGRRLQHRRQRQLPAVGHHRAGLSQGLGTRLLRRLPVQPRGGTADAATRPWLHLLHGRHGQHARRQGLRRLRQCQVRLYVPSRKAWRGSLDLRASTSPTW